MKAVFKYLALLFLGFSMSQCLNSTDDIIEGVGSEVLNKLVVPDGFDFSTTKSVDVDLNVPEFLLGSVFDICYTSSDSVVVQVAEGTFTANGTYNSLLSVPAYVDSIQVFSRSFGLEKELNIAIEDGSIMYDYSSHYTAVRENESTRVSTSTKSAQVGGFTYLGNYTANGYPNYLYKVNDHAWESLLRNLNQTLPEGVSVAQTRLEIISESSQTNLKLKQRSKVYVTFAGEGTSRESALGYFIYNGNKPTDSEHIIIFPNASMPGSGGSLHSGDQVYLGEFAANTTLGWFLVPDGWSKKENKVLDAHGIYYSVASFNTESNVNNRNHMVLLKDIQNEVIVFGFEDDLRDNSTTDHDFNDAVFYITLDNLNAADFTNVGATTSPVDTDGDGVLDINDAYPTDASLAFNNNTVSGSSGSLVFEDLWPGIGDFDFNDLVVDYSFNTITNSVNMIKILDITINVRHVGASYQNGFAFEMPIAASSIESIEGAIFSRNYVNLNPNGTEAGLSNAVVFCFDDGWNVKGQTFTVRVTFTNPLSATELGNFPFNPFIVVDGDRGREIHLADKAPTPKANYDLFGQYSDFSRPSSGRYYRTKNNLPWAINISGQYAIPKEKVSINKGHLKFVPWAESAGIDFPDWYSDLTGYRDYSYLY